MRVTQKMMDRALLADVNDSLSRLSESQRRMASQKKMEKPSDSPGDLQALLAVKDQLSVSAKYRGNISSALLRLQKADEGLSNIYGALAGAKETLARVTGTMSPDARKALALELDNAVSSVLSDLNAKDGNEYVFAGTASAAAPFTAASGTDSDGAVRVQSVVYSGNASVRAAVVNSSETAGTGVSGTEAAEPGAGGVLETLIALRKAVLDGTGTAALQDSLDGHMARLDALQTRLGAETGYLEGLRQRLSAAEITAEERRSSLEDTDFTEETLEQGRRQAEYQAVLTAAAKRSQLSLINYI